MIEFLSSWAKGLGLAIVVVSILEMLLPNNKTKKYIRMVMGIYIMFNIISPLVDNKEIFSVNEIDLETYAVTENTEVVDQTSMNERIEKLYIEELEKDITKKLEKKGYKVNECAVKGTVLEENKITKIKLKLEKLRGVGQTEENIENKIVTEIQKIKKVNIGNFDEEEVKETKIDKTDVQNIKKFLMEEYGVNEKCLVIN